MSETVPRSAGPVTRFWQRHPWFADVLIGLTWLVFAAFGPLVTFSTPSSVAGAYAPALPTVFYVLPVIVAAGAIAGLRRHRPVWGFIVVFVATLPLATVDPSLANLAAAYAVFAIAVYDAPRRAWLCAGISALVTIGIAVLSVFVPLRFAAETTESPWASAATYMIVGSLTLLVALFWGQSAGGRKRYINSLIEHARHLERERDQQAQLAALAERSRIARDVHDIVSHSLSVIVRLADGARAVFDQEPQRAKQAIGELGGVARSSLTEMRRVIGVMESAPDAASPQTGVSYEDLDSLVDVYRGIGLPVELVTRGDSPSQPGVQVTVFRVIQEALTNALRHASAPTTVSVLVETDADVEVTIVNDGAPLSVTEDDHVGRGLVGMRERAALYGGTLDAGPTGEGQWRVRLTLPGAAR
ncbi:MAG: sensor histidine kinase [Rhodoglobus sp.]